MPQLNGKKRKEKKIKERGKIKSGKSKQKSETVDRKEKGGGKKKGGRGGEEQFFALFPRARLEKRREKGKGEMAPAESSSKEACRHRRNEKKKEKRI